MQTLLSIFGALVVCVFSVSAWAGETDESSTASYPTISGGIEAGASYELSAASNVENADSAEAGETDEPSRASAVEDADSPETGKADKLSAASNVEITGSIETGVRIVDDSGDEAKFEEYRDMGSGLYGSGDIRINKDNKYLETEADNIGRDDQRYKLDGGKYNNFKFSVFFDEIPHNYTDDAKSYLNGAGSDRLVDSGNQANPSLWRSYDYYKDRKNMGIKGEFSFESPWVFEIGASRRDSDGIYPFAGTGGVELPAPVDWEETNMFAGAGFQGKSIVAFIRADVSEFDNKNNAMTWGTNTSSLQPDSDFYKISGKFIYRNPFMDSTLALKAGYSKKDNDTNLAVVDPTTFGKYHAEVETTRLNASYDFRPAAAFDIKVFAKYYDTQDDSDNLTINNVTTEPYDHEKWSVGLDGTWRLPKKNFLDAGYQHTDAQRDSRSDNDENQDHLLFVQYRNRFFNRAIFRVKYEYLDRDGDYITGITLDNGNRRYDVADQTRHKIELGTEIFIADNLGGGIDYAWWDRDYDDTVYGMTGMEHHEIYVSANHGDPAKLMTTVYLGYEYDESDLETNRNWSQTEEFDTFSYGIAMEFPVIADKLKFDISWDHSIVDGSADFSPSAANYLDLKDVDDCTIQTFEAKGTWRFTPSWSLNLGYIYEDFDLDDGQYDGYSYLPPGATLTGAYRDQNYDAHIAYLGMVFQF